MMSSPGWIALISAGLAAVGVLLAAQAIRQLRGTTLVAPLAWLLGAQLAVGGVEVAGGFGQLSPVPLLSLRLAAATMTLCPLMALLGAKRPQNRAWHFVVLSLWVILVLPAAGPLVQGGGTALRVPWAWSWLMLILVAMGFANALFTRLWPAAVLLAAGQLVLLAPHLPWLGRLLPLPDVYRGAAGLALLAAALATAVARYRTRRTATSPLDRLWRDFRDLFGVLWGLRVAERINAAAKQHGWPLVLRWDGFRTNEGGPIEGELAPETARLVQQNLRNLLRRFVSRAWIARRLDEHAV